jgi:prepilin-type processing-associated H-X9-DG protein
VCPAQEAAAEIVASEDAPTLFDDQSYFYLGYAMYNEEMGLAFLDAYRRVVEDCGDFEGRKLPLVAPTRSGGHDSLRRFTQLYSLTLDRSVLQIHYGLDKELAFSEIPVMVERPGHHKPMGGHVLYLDGHVEYLRYPGRFPMTKSFIEGLYELDALGRKLLRPEALDVRSREDDAQSERH